MLKPYYEDKYATIYHGDSEIVTKQLIDQHYMFRLDATSELFDLVLTDPPYGMNYQSAWRTASKRFDKIHGDDSFPMLGSNMFQ